MAVTGILLIDKEEGWTSHDVVAKLRGVLGERRIGHAGTLDPMATGLLVVLTGRATRAASFAEAEEKEYIAALRPGLVTDTQDVTGTPLSRSDSIPGEEALLALLPRFTGVLSQLPPMYSAVKVRGQRLYAIARKGQEVERQPREITVRTLEYLGQRDGDFLLRVVCSKGTYIRTLCHDIGAALGCGGCMAALRRTRCGVFDVKDACTVSEAAAGRLLGVDALFSAYPACTLNAAQERRCRCGGDFPVSFPEGECRFYGEGGDFLAFGRITNGRGISIRSFFEVEG